MPKFTKTVSIGGVSFSWDGETGQVIGAELHTESPGRLRSVKVSAHDGVYEFKIIMDSPPNEIPDRPDEVWERTEPTAL